MFKLLVVLALLWSGWWYGAGFFLRGGVSAWFGAQQARGWQADYADISTSGYPLRHFTTLTSPALADPANGTAWQADWLHLESPAIWPGSQTLHFADTPQRLSYFDSTVVITARDLIARLRLHPGLALSLRKMELTSKDWQITSDEGLEVTARSLEMAMVQGEHPDTYQFNINATDFTPGTGLRMLIRSSHALPASFETMNLDMQVQFDRVWDRSALEQGRPQPIAIDLHLAELQWGALRLMAAGNVTVDAGGIPTGVISLKAENWQEMLGMAQAAGAIPPEAVSPVQRALSLLAGMGGNPNALDVKLNLQGGFITFGPIPLGPAPRLIIR